MEKLTELTRLSANLGSVLAVVSKGNVKCVGSKEIKCLLKSKSKDYHSCLI